MPYNANMKNNRIIAKFQKIEKKEEGNFSRNLYNSENHPKNNIKSNFYKEKSNKLILILYL